MSFRKKLKRASTRIRARRQSRRRLSCSIAQTYKSLYQREQERLAEKKQLETNHLKKEPQP